MIMTELITALEHLKVETGSLACLGCGHEHNCSTHGCAIIQEAAEQLARLQKAFALACRILGDDGWARWQEHIMERVDGEQVCRVCGCTQDNACLGGCCWVEDDLCSQCAAKMDEEET